MAQQELKVIADFYDFMLWLIRHTEKFPRHHRYSLSENESADYTDFTDGVLAVCICVICEICGQNG